MDQVAKDRALLLIERASRLEGRHDVRLVVDYLRSVNQGLSQAIDALRNGRNTAQQELADERAAHAVTQAERNAARRDMVAAMRAVCEDKTPTVREAALELAIKQALNGLECLEPEEDTDDLADMADVWGDLCGPIGILQYALKP